MYSDFNLASNKFEGTMMLLRKSGHFGEQALIANEKHTKKFIAGENNTRCIVLNAQVFLDILRPLLYKIDDLVSEVCMYIVSYSFITDAV